MALPTVGAVGCRPERGPVWKGSQVYNTYSELKRVMHNLPGWAARKEIQGASVSQQCLVLRSAAAKMKWCRDERSIRFFKKGSALGGQGRQDYKPGSDNINDKFDHSAAGTTCGILLWHSVARAGCLAAARGPHRSHGKHASLGAWRLGECHNVAGTKHIGRPAIALQKLVDSKETLCKGSQFRGENGEGPTDVLPACCCCMMH